MGEGWTTAVKHGVASGSRATLLYSSYLHCFYLFLLRDYDEFDSCWIHSVKARTKESARGRVSAVESSRVELCFLSRPYIAGFPPEKAHNSFHIISAATKRHYKADTVATKYTSFVEMR